MIGDSVSLKMWAAVNNTLLNSTTTIAPFHVPINAGPTSEGVRCIAEWLGTDPDRWDAITYNFVRDARPQLSAASAPFGLTRCLQGMWNIGPDDCDLRKNSDGRYLDAALETYIGGLANLTATLALTRAAKDGAVFFVNTNPTADVKECCTSWPHAPPLAPGMLGTHSCYQRTSVYNAAAAELLAPYNISVVDIYAWAVKRCGDPRTWGYSCDIVPQPNCTSPQPGQTCPRGACHDKQAYCNTTDHNCYNGTNCGACQVHPSSRAGPTGFMSGSDYFSIPVSEAVKKALLTDDASAAARRERVSACPPKSACFPWGPFRAPCNATQRSLLPVFCDPTQPFAARARELVSKLTLAEKVSQLSNGKPPQPIPRLGIPAYEWWGEASHGIATSASVTFRPPTPSATSFPEQIGTAASFDAELFGMVGEAIGKEARAMMNAGNAGGTFWAPNINVRASLSLLGVCSARFDRPPLAIRL